MESYDKLKEIGKGSYGVVWLVKNKKDKKNYVLKRIDLRKTSERDKLSAQQEAQLLKSLKHPNIVSYKESFQVDGFLHIVMLYCDGGDLYSKIKEQNGKYLEETQIVEWFVQIAMALQYMHENNILHRDLKTQNIFLTRNKIIKVGDLGIARVLKGNNDMATTIIGTPYYMSPELFSNKPYNSKSDVWALGCCVYEMTTLKHAFNAKDMTSLVFKITKGKMPPVSSHYSKELILLIESMLNLDPKKRPTVNRILRDPYIKKNIMLFLERTKKLQQENEIKISNKPKEITEAISKSSLNNEKSVEDEKPDKQAPEPRIPRHNNSQPNLIDHYKKDDEITRVKSENNVLINQNNKQKEQEVYENDSAADNNQIKTGKSGIRVRISSVVEDIETKQFYNINNSSFKSESEAINNFNEIESSNKEINQEPSSDKKYNDNSQNKPRIFSIAPKRNILENNEEKPKIINNSDNLPQQANQMVQPVLNARERRRQRLRLSQNDSNSDSKPPILRRYNVHQSDGFISNNHNSNNILPAYESPFINHQRREILPKKEIKQHQQELQDSLKIIKNSQLQNNNVNNDVIIKNLANQMEKNPFLTKKKIQSSNNNNSPSSSSSSISSSSDDNDPGKELIRFEKRKIKEKKEMDNFISKLNSTLNAANMSKNESEVEDLKDELFDDLEEEVLQAVNENSLDSVNDISMKNKPKRTSFFNNNLNDSNTNNNNSSKRQNKSNDDSTDDDDNIVFSGPSKLQVNPMGATNHIHNRINNLEDEFLNLLGKKKLEEAFKILDDAKEDELESKLISLMGKQIYDSYSGKLWLLKFCKDVLK